MRHCLMFFCCLDKMRDRKKELDETVANEKLGGSKESFE